MPDAICRTVPPGHVALQGQPQAGGDVVDVGVVARRRPVAVDHHRLAAVDGLEEHVHGALLPGAPRAVHVGEPKRDRAQAVALGERVRVALASELARPVRRDRLGQRALVDGRRGVADERASGRCLHGPLHPGAARGVEHAERAEHVDVEVRGGILDRLDDRARGGEMDDRPHAVQGGGRAPPRPGCRPRPARRPTPARCAGSPVV